MQQTKLDRWLREKYTYITNVYSNTKPDQIPAGISLTEIDIKSGAPYRYRFSSRNKASINALARRMESEKITFTSRVEDRDVWYGRFINNPKKSFSYRLFWITCIFGILLFAVSPLPRAFWAYASTEEDAPPAGKLATSKKGPSPKEKFNEWEGRFAKPGK